MHKGRSKAARRWAKHGPPAEATPELNLPPLVGPSPTDPGQGGAQPGAPTGSPSGSPRQRPPTTGGARRPPGGSEAPQYSGSGACHVCRRRADTGPVTRSRLTLRIQPTGGEPFEVTTRVAFPTPEERSRIKVGKMIGVRYDSEDHRRVVVDPEQDAGTDAFFHDGPFADRIDAGRLLGERMALCQDSATPVVVALPRGGVPVGAQVARRLGAPLAAMPVGKVGAPGREELAVGAVAPGGVTVLNLDVIAALHLGPDEVERLVSKAAAKVAHQVELYGRGVPLSGRSVVVVDDGLATGASMRAALIAVRECTRAGSSSLSPWPPPKPSSRLAPLVDEQVCVLRPERMEAVGAWYKDFSQTTDAEVARFLGELGAQPAAPGRPSPP